MAVRVGINGFGRIGRQSLKAILERAGVSGMRNNDGAADCEARGACR